MANPLNGGWGIRNPDSPSWQLSYNLGGIYAGHLYEDLRRPDNSRLALILQPGEPDEDGMEVFVRMDADDLTNAARAVGALVRSNWQL